MSTYSTAEQKGMEASVTKGERGTIRAAVADLVRARGCGCCGGGDKWDDAIARLADILEVETYGDGSGYDFTPYETSYKRRISP